jgi:minor extracellular serine protease Vpr
MLRVFRILALLVLVCSMPLQTALADSAAPVSPREPLPTRPSHGPVDETPSLWFVEFASPPAVDGSPAAALDNDRLAFQTEAAQAGLDYEQRLSFNTLWNGISVSIKSTELSKLQRLPAVKAVYPVQPVKIPKSEPIKPELATALMMTGADVVQNELGITGKGLKVGVIDTGIDYDHPDLGGCFGSGCRVAVGYDFVGDNYDPDPFSPTFSPTPVPDDNPDDCYGHGTHVAGIIGAKGKVTGVAPDVTFGAYRVFGCQGSTSDDILLKAMERAHADGMNIINMSLGSAFQWPQYPTAQAANRLVDAGMVVVAAAGNEGESGLYSAGAPGLASKVIGVASYDNTHVAAIVFKANPDDRKIPYLALDGGPKVPTSGTPPELVSVGQGCAADDYDANPEGKVALIVRGGCTFDEKYLKAVQNGAKGVVIYNNVPGIFAGGGLFDRGIFAVGITQEDGEYLKDQIKNAKDPVTITWTNDLGEAPVPTGGLISSFSSYGLGPDLSVKPDLGAPGGYIRSTVPLEQGGYAIFSGTSMSSPHVAGAAALLLQAKPNTRAVDVAGILENNAVPKLWAGDTSLDILEPVNHQGAGLLRIDSAIEATTRITPAKLAMGESQAGTRTFTLTLSNSASRAVMYDLLSTNALSTGGLMEPSFWSSDASVEFSQPTVNIPAGDTAQVDVTIHPATKPAQSQYSGYLIFKPRLGGLTLRVPFAGYVGDYQAIKVLEPTANGFPWLAKLTGSGLENMPKGAPFAMVAGDTPYFVLHFEHQASRVVINLYNAKTKKPWHVIFADSYFPRNATEDGFYVFPWDGYAKAGTGFAKVPDGQYYARIAVLHALGDPKNPEDWDTWVSPVFTISWAGGPL